MSARHVYPSHHRSIELDGDQLGPEERRIGIKHPRYFT
ncbi:hypothetical protein PDIG_86570 [Penicillium digitatum PHI26]|uniref:Uncharacterized protein n=2 Tax=Penicillium digitatum TaxID=36651 RepID=K9FUV4_PEND2|nr:hypothetical protein PDIP_32580 [Penicillium digitatum Pd1]EKV04856.1 hypothetical protein PDIG_86570 [Penicillium digitatum PHI26]EKV17138.1 hypothetical protein PDIP_32580 [Penicillium digitatum Pd1]